MITKRTREGGCCVDVVRSLSMWLDVRVGVYAAGLVEEGKGSDQDGIVALNCLNVVLRLSREVD